MGTLKNGPHGRIKALAVQVLKLKGFTDEQIHEEYSFTLPGLKKTIVADVIGINQESNYSMIVECGVTPTDRLAQFKLFADDVLYIPFVTSLEDITDRKKLESEIMALKAEVNDLKKQVEFYKQKERDFWDSVYNFREKYDPNFGS